MKKYLVISYYDGCISIDAIKDTYEEAKEFMDQDVYDFIISDEDYANVEIGNDYGDVGYTDAWSAFANTGGNSPCDWVIKEIEI